MHCSSTDSVTAFEDVLELTGSTVFEDAVDLCDGAEDGDGGWSTGASSPASHEKALDSGDQFLVSAAGGWLAGALDGAVTDSFTFTPTTAEANATARFLALPSTTNWHQPSLPGAIHTASMSEPSFKASGTAVLIEDGDDLDHVPRDQLRKALKVVADAGSLAKGGSPQKKGWGGVSNGFSDGQRRALQSKGIETTRGKDAGGDGDIDADDDVWGADTWAVKQGGGRYLDTDGLVADGATYLLMSLPLLHDAAYNAPPYLAQVRTLSVVVATADAPPPGNRSALLVQPGTRVANLFSLPSLQLPISTPDEGGLSPEFTTPPHPDYATAADRAQLNQLRVEYGGVSPLARMHRPELAGGSYLDGLMKATIRQVLLSSTGSFAAFSPSPSQCSRQDSSSQSAPNYTSSLITNAWSVSQPSTSISAKSGSAPSDPRLYQSSLLEHTFGWAAPDMAADQGTAGHGSQMQKLLPGFGVEHYAAVKQAFETVAQLVDKMLPGFSSGEHVTRSVGALGLRTSMHSSIVRASMCEPLCPIAEVAHGEGQLISPSGDSPGQCSQDSSDNPRLIAPWAEDQGELPGGGKAPWAETGVRQERASVDGEGPLLSTAPESMPDSSAKLGAEAVGQGQRRTVNMQVFSDEESVSAAALVVTDRLSNRNSTVRKGTSSLPRLDFTGAVNSPIKMPTKVGLELHHRSDPGLDLGAQPGLMQRLLGCFGSS